MKMAQKNSCLATAALPVRAAPAEFVSYKRKAAL